MNRGLHFVAHKSIWLWSILIKFTETLVSWDGSQAEALQPMVYCRHCKITAVHHVN